MHWRGKLPTCDPNQRDRMQEMSSTSAHWDEAKARRDETRVKRGFWPKIRRIAARMPFAEDLLTAYYCAFDRTTPRHVQVALIGALAYFVLPFDIAPDLLPIIGFTDDAAVLATALKLVASNIRPEHREAAKAALARGLGQA